MVCSHQFLLDLLFDLKFLFEFKPYTSNDTPITGNDLKVIAFLLEIIYQWELDINTAPIVTTSYSNISSKTNIPNESLRCVIKKLEDFKIHFSQAYDRTTSTPVIEIIDFTVFEEVPSDELVIGLPDAVIYSVKNKLKNDSDFKSGC